MVFKDLKGIEGIDTLNECVPYVEKIFADKGISEKIKTLPTMQAAPIIYKAHKETIEKIMDILDEKPKDNSTVSLIATVSKILSSICSDGETLAFFTASCPSLKSMILPMVNTEGEQSADL